MTKSFMVVFVEQLYKTLLDWCENKWIYYLNAKININKNFLSSNCDYVLNSFQTVECRHYKKTKVASLNFFSQCFGS